MNNLKKFYENKKLKKGEKRMTKRQIFLTKNLIKNATTRIVLHTHTHHIPTNR
mgnify:CR=1 FL=1